MININDSSGENQFVNKKGGHYMKILHLMQREKFTRSQVAFYNNRMDRNIHEICYVNFDNISQIDFTLEIAQHEFFLDKKIGGYQLKEFVKFLKKYDYIVIHSLFIGPKIMMRIIKERLIKKIIWIEWGYDLYVPKVRFTNYIKNRRGLRTFIKDRISQYFKNNVNTFVGIFPPDCDYYKQIFPRSKAKVHYAPYCEADVPNEFLTPYKSTSSLEKSIQNNDTIYIQVGHNGNQMLNHIETLNSLKKFKDENIKILLPLSYAGGKEYVDKVQKTAEELFPGKVICLREMMDPNDYFNLISRVDIAVFNTFRQCGLGNIYRMIFRNVKIFMSGQGMMYDYFVDNGVPVQNFDLINNMSFKEFTKLVKIKDKEKFDKFIYKLSHMDWEISCWNDLYNNLPGKIPQNCGEDN